MKGNSGEQQQTEERAKRKNGDAEINFWSLYFRGGDDQAKM